MYVNAENVKIIPAETISGIRGWGNGESGGRGEIKV
jgi:hypothetical protein